jgi:hypothetical protein
LILCCPEPRPARRFRAVHPGKPVSPSPCG